MTSDDSVGVGGERARAACGPEQRLEPVWGVCLLLGTMF